MGEEKKFLTHDMRAYTAVEFLDYFGKDKWSSKWSQASEATQLRMARDGNIYTVSEFLGYYKNGWQQEWWTAPEVRCKECKPYSLANVALGRLRLNASAPGLAATLLM